MSKPSKPDKLQRELKLCMNTTYFVWTTKTDVSRKASADIDAAVKQIDPTMSFVRHYAPGNDTHGWLERNNDGTNDQNWRVENNRKCVEIAKARLGIKS
jgi:hypothetical protein